MKKISLIMGSDSDLEVCADVIDTLKQFEALHEVKILSAHRTPLAVFEFAKNARVNGIGAIIAAAGGAAHLAGVIASHTTLPVIALPIKTKFLDGLDSLLSVVQMPKGVPVACVSINGAANAALLALEILSIENDILTKKLDKFKATLEKSVLDKNENLKKNEETN